jgi:hypothetical protein
MGRWRTCSPHVVCTDGRAELIEPLDLPRAQRDAVGSGVLFDAGEALVPGIGAMSSPWAAASQRDLRRGGVELGGDGLDRVDDPEVLLKVVLDKPRVGLAPVIVGEVLRRADRSGEEAVAERRVGHEPDTELAQQRQQLGLRITGPQGVLGLQRGDWVHGVRAADRLGPASDSPMCRTLPSAISSARAPMVSSIGVLGSTRCW